MSDEIRDEADEAARHAHEAPNKWSAIGAEAIDEGADKVATLTEKAADAGTAAVQQAPEAAAGIAGRASDAYRSHPRLTLGAAIGLTAGVAIVIILLARRR